MISHFYIKKYNIQFNVDDKYKSKISTYLTYDNKNVWSPAKISHICLRFLDDKNNYFENIYNEIKNSYDDEVKLLN